MRLFNKILIGFVVSIVVFLLVFFAVNLFDEAPTQLALEMEKPLPVYTVPDDENGFLLALAFNAPAEEDPVAYGRKIVDAWNWYMKNSTGSNEDYSVYESLLSNRSLKFTGERKHCAFTGADRCWQKITDEDRQETKRLLNDNQKLIERYRRLQTMPDYFNGMYLHPAHWQPISFSLTDVCRVLGDAAMQNAKWVTWTICWNSPATI